MTTDNKQPSAVKLRRRMQRRRAGATLFGSLCVLLACVTALAGSFQNELNSFMGITSFEVQGGDGATYYASEYDSIDEMMEAKVALTEDLTDEGIVLLKNNGALPLAGNGKVTALGRGSVDLIYAGASGAGIIGNVGTGINATLKEGLEAAGFSVNPTMWDFYSNSGVSRINGGAGGNSGYAIGEVPLSSYPDDKGYDDYGDAAIVVLTRNSGESNEAPSGEFNDGEVYYRLNQDERDLIEEAKGNFDTVVVIANSPSAMELDELNDDEQIDAILQCGGLGMSGAKSLGSILAGTVNPSGHLTDTYAANSLSSPAMSNHGDYSYSNADEITAASENGKAENNTKYLVQQEGIYTGYKYYETRYEDTVLQRGNASSETGTFASEGVWDYDDEVTWSFGYGLSYTTFQQELENVRVADNAVVATVKVTNTGDVPGKSVVQLYAQSPYTQYDIDNGVEKSSVQLLSFDKTDTLKPGQSQTIALNADLYSVASYDTYGQGTWILDDGDYRFAIGSDAHDALNNILAAKGYDASRGMDADGDASKVSTWTNGTFTTLEVPEFSDNGFTTQNGLVRETNDVTVENHLAHADLNTWMPEDRQISYLSRSDWSGTWPESQENLTATDEMITHLLAQVYEPGDEDTSSIVMGVDNGVELVDLIGKDYDDPLWDQLLEQMTLQDMVDLTAKNFSATNGIDNVGYPGTIENDGPSGIVTNYSSKYDHGSTIFPGIENYSSINPRMYPSQSLIASAFNRNLVYEQGRMFGEDSLYTEQTEIWAPGLNLHRTPYSGRNFEYYSEDSQMTYILGAEMASGIQSNGAICAVKHFAFNDYETNRFGLSTFLNEQTARENGLRGFEGAITVGHARNVMTTLARIGVDWIGQDSEMQDSILRAEWGFDGYVVTDNAIQPYMKEYAITYGTDKFVVFVPDRYDQLLLENAPHDLKLLTALRQACHRILYVNVNSNAMNGMSAGATVVQATPAWKAALIVACVVMGVIAALFTIWSVLADRRYRKLACLEMVDGTRVRRGAGCVLGIIGAMVMMVAGVMYITASNDSYGLDIPTVVAMVAAVVMLLVAAVGDPFRYGNLVTGLLMALSFGLLLKSRLVYLLTGVLGISQDGIAGGIIGALLMIVVAGLFNLAAAFFSAKRHMPINR